MKSATKNTKKPAIKTHLGFRKLNNETTHLYRSLYLLVRKLTIIAQ